MWTLFGLVGVSCPVAYSTSLASRAFLVLFVARWVRVVAHDTWKNAWGPPDGLRPTRDCSPEGDPWTVLVCLLSAQ